ncbi:MAG: sugar transferase [Lachnospiraceae bacterium]|nr:sugar transferase [Lachnospiraceae bacterium]
MYRKETEGWSKHYDFILLDMICLQTAFILSYAFSGYGWYPYANLLYRNMAVFIELADVIVIVLFGTFKGVLKRGHYQNFLITIRHAVITGALAVLYLFLIQKGQNYSRLAFVTMICFYAAITYVIREMWKRALRKQMVEGRGRSLLIVTTEEAAEIVIGNIKKNNYARYKIVGVAIIDRNLTGRKIDEVEVVAGEKTAAEYVCQGWVDEVLVVTHGTVPYPSELIDQLLETGVTVHLNLAKISNVPGKRQLIEKIGTYTVLTTSINYASSGQLFLKRLMDILGGVVGCMFTGIIFLFVAPIIYISSPGPIFFSQERVGKNGKKFRMYKFRSMYMDAEERKVELMKENKMEDGKMFKLDFDPRVIGNTILPDGTKKTGIGNFIRKTSLDEFPQFFNVLKGDMSIVGTRPPLADEVNLYERHHRVRLAIKPGITGMWQVSGRSDITDFEEVVRLDREYIAGWNIGLDIKILLKTVLVVLRMDGSV